MFPNSPVLEDRRAMDALDESLYSGGKRMNEGESLSGFYGAGAAGAGLEDGADAK